MQKVPVLIDFNKTHDDNNNDGLINNKKIIWESHTILRYLIAMYGDSNWYPSCPFKRSLYERWLDWSQTIFQPAFMGTFWGYYRVPEN